jgi:putative SOS response-associated peptidase YedK
MTACRSFWPRKPGPCGSADLDQLKSLLKPYPTGDMVGWPVDRRVGNVKNKDPALIEPAAATG